MTGILRNPQNVPGPEAQSFEQQENHEVPCADRRRTMTGDHDAYYLFGPQISVAAVRCDPLCILSWRKEQAVVDRSPVRGPVG
jgi:hypothetical protein